MVTNRSERERDVGGGGRCRWLRAVGATHTRSSSSLEREKAGIAGEAHDSTSVDAAIQD